MADKIKYRYYNRIIQETLVFEAGTVTITDEGTLQAFEYDAGVLVLIQAEPPHAWTRLRRIME